MRLLSGGFRLSILENFTFLQVDLSIPNSLAFDLIASPGTSQLIDDPGDYALLFLRFVDVRLFEFKLNMMHNGFEALDLAASSLSENVAEEPHHGRRAALLAFQNGRVRFSYSDATVFVASGGAG